MSINAYHLAADKMAGHEKSHRKLTGIHTKKAHGGHIHTHHFDDGSEENHVTQGTDGMVDHMLQHMSEPNPGEAEADAGQSAPLSQAAGQDLGA